MQEKLVNPPFAVDYNTNVMNIQATPDLRKYAIIHVSIEGRYINIDIIDVNLDINMQIYIDAIKKILNSMFSVIESINSLEQLFLTNTKYYENQNIFKDSFDPSADPRDNGASRLNNVILFSIYNNHKDLILKQIQWIKQQNPMASPLTTGKDLKELLEGTLMNPDIGFM